MINLTEEQNSAVLHSQGPACVVAGAGTGKTTALVYRIFFLVDHQNIAPNRIIITTFTRKATAELYDRAFQHLGKVAQQLRISTIDALIWDFACKAMHRELMRSAQLIGEPNQRVLLFHCAWEEFGNKSTCSRNIWTEKADKAGLVSLLEKSIRAEMANRQEKQKIYCLIQSKLDELKNRSHYYSWFSMPNLNDLKLTAKRYYKKLKELTATDYDLMNKDFLLCLKQYKEFSEELVSESDAILVDEFQDVSDIQAEILLLLSGKRRNIWVVGDPCQQIYEWRGAGSENMLWFIKVTRAKKYYLTENWRSTQAILNCAYHLLSKKIPSIETNGMLKLLISKRDQESVDNVRHPVYTATLEQALLFIKRYLKSNPKIKQSDIALLSSKLDSRTRNEIEDKTYNKFNKQYYSSRADSAMEGIIGTLPAWKPGNALNNLYKHPDIQNLVSRSLISKIFFDLRSIRPLATASEAIDSTLPPQAFTFIEAWPALKNTQDREVSVTNAVISKQNAIQVMTIHAAKGLEFPIVILMKFGKAFPNPVDTEDYRLAYVGATRARDILIIVHTIQKPIEILSALGDNLIPIRDDRTTNVRPKIKAYSKPTTPPIIAATDLDLYEQCPLKFAAYHEGRFLPKWSIPQSIGSRMHKALEYYLRAGIKTDKTSINNCFKRGLQDGDSPLRKLPCKDIEKMKQSYKEIIETISETSQKVLSIESRYRYLHDGSGQIDGVVDAVIEQRDGVIVLKEWKTSTDIETKKRQYELQARAGALGFCAQSFFPIQMVEIVPIFNPALTISLRYDDTFMAKTNEMLDKVFKDLNDRRYEPQRGNHCKLCQLKFQCPAWYKS
ncbi:ATP-dependent helicase [bacterium]|nr:ATP-dependent helicase [bacterium]